MHPDIQNLLCSDGSKNTLYDREQMLREVLRLKLTAWLDRGSFDNFSINEFRDVVMDINGMSKDGAREVPPKDIQRLHCLPFASFTPVTRRTALFACLEHAGINEVTAIDYFGVNGWQSILSKVDQVCKAYVEGANKPEPWVVLSVMSRIKEIFDRDSFSICSFDAVYFVLNDLRKAIDWNLTETVEMAQARAGLRALHCVDYEAMSDEVMSKARDGIFLVLGLNEQSCQILLGDGAWNEIASLRFQNAKVRSTAHIAAKASIFDGFIRFFGRNE